MLLFVLFVLDHVINKCDNESCVPNKQLGINQSLLTPSFLSLSKTVETLNISNNRTGLSDGSDFLIQGIQKV